MDTGYFDLLTIRIRKLFSGVQVPWDPIRHPQIIDENSPRASHSECDLPFPIPAPSDKGGAARL